MAAKVTKVERLIALVPFVKRVRREMERAGIHTWSEIEVIKVHTDAGVVGYGETIQNYTWGRVNIEERVLGQTPFAAMWDDSLGAGLQMALFDAAGKLAGVPVYKLLGPKCRDWCPISYWMHDTSPEQYAEEARVAVGLGYTCMKTKPRPWYDVRRTMQLISEATPPHFAIDADWNAFLVNAGTALPLLRELEDNFPKIKIFEDPIPRDDASGNRLLRQQIKTPIAHHYGVIPARTGLELGGVCDGFVVGGGVAATMAQGHTAGQLNMPFFLQMVGTGLTTIMALHLSAVLTHSQWPSITCHELYEHSLLRHPIEVLGGHARVPEAPGLGVEMDEDALQQYRVDRADHTLPRRLIRVSRACGVRVYFASTAQKWAYFGQVNQPVNEWGNHTELLDDDGSANFAKLYAVAAISPVLTRE